MQNRLKKSRLFGCDNIFALLPAILISGTLATANIVPGAPEARNTPPGLQVKDGKFLLNGKPCRAVGVNYYDLLTRRVSTPADNSSLEGLKRLAKAGIPFVRFNGGGYSPGDWEKYRTNKAAYFAEYDRVVATAEKAGIGLVPSLLWNPNLQKLVGEHRDAWGNPNSKTIALMRAYVGDVVKRYRHSPAIWAWELGNEWNLKLDLPNAKNFREDGEDERDDFTSAQLAVAMKEFAAAVRAHDPHRPILSGHSHPRFSAWHNTHERSWSADSFEQWREVILRDNPEEFDTLGIHIYAETEPREACGRWAESWVDYLQKLRSLANEKRRPVFVGEFGLAEGKDRSQEQVKERFREILSAMTATGIDLAAVWVFDLPSQKDSWNIDFENHRAYMLHDVVEANHMWQKKP